MGAHFHHPALACTWEALDAFRMRARLALWAADAGGDDVSARSRTAPARLAVAVGNEGGGLSAACRARADAIIAIPMSGAVESLNVSAAAAVLLYELRPPSLRPEGSPPA
jgi:TrmH family RNA methyltransferase